MTLKYLLPALAFTVATAASAEDYQLFTSLNAEHVRVSGDSETNFGLNGQYFFDKKHTLGPLDQFEYINKVSNVSAAFARVYDNNTWQIGGEYFAENKFVVMANYQNFDNFDVKSIGLGYLISDDFIVRAQAIKPEDSDTAYAFSASYNHQLQGSDYIGFSAFTDDEFDYYGVSSKYFASLNNGRYIAVGVLLADDDGSSDWSANADYYFSQRTSIGASYNKADAYRLTAKHFFNQSWAVEAGFASNTDSSELKTYSLALTGQF